MDRMNGKLHFQLQQRVAAPGFVSEDSDDV